MGCRPFTSSLSSDDDPPRFAFFAVEWPEAELGPSWSSSRFEVDPGVDRAESEFSYLVVTSPKGRGAGGMTTGGCWCDMSEVGDVACIGLFTCF